MRDTELMKTQPLPLGPQSLVGEADRRRQLNTIATMKARTRCSDVTRKDRWLREGLAEGRQLGLALRGKYEATWWKDVEVVVSTEHPLGKKP